MTKTAEDKIEDMLEDHLDGIREDFRDRMTEAGDNVCESPIELMMCARLLLFKKPYGELPHFNTFWPYFSPDEGPGGGIRPSAFEVVIVPQWELGQYRADFLVLYAIPRPVGGLELKKFVVECDGHDFHEKTKEQASRDKARDRYFNARGCAVFRYTGSEIFRNADDLLHDLEHAMMRSAEEVFATYKDERQ